MSKHTDQTSQMIKAIQHRLSSYDKNYSIKFTLSEPKNKDTYTIDEVKYRMVNGVNWAKRRGYIVEYTIVEIPKEPLKFNCKGCRKRKSGNYFWVTALMKSKTDKSNNEGWDNQLAKVCSKECGELMILRLA